LAGDWRQTPRILLLLLLLLLLLTWGRLRVISPTPAVIALVRLNGDIGGPIFRIGGRPLQTGIRRLDNNEQSNGTEGH
jgi:hypothetical protein